MYYKYLIPSPLNSNLRLLPLWVRTERFEPLLSRNRYCWTRYRSCSLLLWSSRARLREGARHKRLLRWRPYTSKWDAGIDEMGRRGEDQGKEREVHVDRVRRK